MSRIIGSYVLVSYQSQTCSSHCIESCITTRTPWLGKRNVQTQSLEKYEYNGQATAIKNIRNLLLEGKFQE